VKDNFNQIIINKRDGTKEAYDPDKIIQVAEAAGLEVPLAVKLAQQINEWISGQKQNRFTSLQIRDQIQKVLYTLNPHVADLYRWYQKTKDIKRRG
jgi:2-phosphoglycerate kinase